MIQGLRGPRGAPPPCWRPYRQVVERKQNSPRRNPDKPPVMRPGLQLGTPFYYLFFNLLI